MSTFKDFLRNMSNLSGINPLGYYYMWQIADNALIDVNILINLIFFKLYLFLMITASPRNTFGKMGD